MASSAALAFVQGALKIDLCREIGDHGSADRDACCKNGLPLLDFRRIERAPDSQRCGNHCCKHQGGRCGEAGRRGARSSEHAEASDDCREGRMTAALKPPSLLRTATGEPPLGRNAEFFADDRGEIFEHDNSRHRSSWTRIGVRELEGGKWPYRRAFIPTSHPSTHVPRRCTLR